MDKHKILDLRFVIGVFFTIIGLLLLVYSFIQLRYAMGEYDSRVINRWCGLTFGVFGVVMLILSFTKDANDELITEHPSDER